MCIGKTAAYSSSKPQVYLCWILRSPLVSIESPCVFIYGQGQSWYMTSYGAFPKCEIPKPLLSHEKNKQLWMICWVPKKFKKLPGSSSSFIISFAKLQKLPSELLLAQPASPLRATVSWTPDQKSRRAIEPFVAAPKILELGWCSNRVEEKCGFYWLKRSFQNDLWKPGIHRNTPNWNVNISIDLFSLQCFLL